MIFSFYIALYKIDITMVSVFERLTKQCLINI